MKSRNTRPTHQTLMTLAIAVLLSGCATPGAMTWQVVPNYRITSPGPDAGLDYAALARQYEAEQRWRDALEAWRKAALAAPENPDVLNSLGLAEAKQGLYGNAVAVLRRAVALDAQRPALLNNLGYALLLASRAEEAQEILRAALVLEPDYRLARSNLSRADQLVLIATPSGNAMARAATPTTPLPLPLPLPLPSSPALQLQTVPNAAPLQLRQASLMAPALATALAPAAPTAPATALPLVPTVVVAASMQAVAVPREATTLPRVEIANGNGVTGMAARLSGWMRERGLAKNARLSNARPFNTATTVVYYREGYFAAAQQFAARLPHRAELALAPGGTRHADVRIVLGHDLRAPTPCDHGCPTPAAKAPTPALGATGPGPQIAQRGARREAHQAPSPWPLPAFAVSARNPVHFLRCFPGPTRVSA